MDGMAETTLGKAICDKFKNNHDFGRYEGRKALNHSSGNLHLNIRGLASRLKTFTVEDSKRGMLSSQSYLKIFEGQYRYEYLNGFAYIQYG